VITTLFEDVKRSAGATVRLACVGALIGLLAAVALFFFTLAAFIWAEGKYGAIVAGLGLGVFFFAFATAIFVAARARRRSLARQEQMRQALQQAVLNERALSAIDPKWWTSTVASAIGTEILRLIGAGRNAPEETPRLVRAIGLSAVFLAALSAIALGKSRNDEQPK
jgi:hypothetical protein